jgi:hypothetical protein
MDEVRFVCVWQTKSTYAPLPEAKRCEKEMLTTDLTTPSPRLGGQEQFYCSPRRMGSGAWFLDFAYTVNEEG